MSDTIVRARIEGSCHRSLAQGRPGAPMPRFTPRKLPAGRRARQDLQDHEPAHPWLLDPAGFAAFMRRGVRPSAWLRPRPPLRSF